MTDDELQVAYEKAYIEEFDKYSAITTLFTEKARDKDYAENMGLGLTALISIFQNSKMNRDVVALYDHTYKLGGSVGDVVRAIPDLAKSYKMEADEWHEQNKHEASIEYKKFLGIIPYGIKNVSIAPAIRMGSIFEDLTDEKELATELGRLKAIFAIQDKVRHRAKEKGLLFDSSTTYSTLEPELLESLKSALTENDLNKFFKALQSLFASLSYNIKVTEAFFHSNIHLVLRIIGVDIRSEEETNVGRIDAVIETDKHVYIIEFKKDSTSVAVEQIMARKYYQKYLMSQKEIILVGVALDYIKKNIKNWEVYSLKKLN